jgi:N-acetylglucosaminyl-diphospho-decaprenol L-rhamnosyltransferase
MHTTVILVTHQSDRVLDACLDQLDRLRDIAVLVVDNASTDSTRERARARGVRLLPRPGNSGFAAAANEGARQATGPLLCFLNPDCLLTPETLAAARMALAGKPKACAVPDFVQCGAVLAGRQPGYTWRKVLADLMENNRRWPRLTRHLRRHPRHDDATWHWPLGTCLFLHAEFFRALGGFDERYFLYMEDVDLGWRVHQAGGEIISLPTRINHGHMQGSALSLQQRLPMLNQARVQFAHRHFGTWAGLGARLLVRS